VIVLNCDKIAVTGNRLDTKMYYRHSGYFGGLSEINLRDQLQKHPERALRFAIQGMLPKGPLGRKMLSKLKLYVGSEHPHSAQKPQALTFEEKQ
jgi:large subunit ribosomal protein L13